MYDLIENIQNIELRKGNVLAEMLQTSKCLCYIEKKRHVHLDNARNQQQSKTFMIGKVPSTAVEHKQQEVTLPIIELLCIVLIYLMFCLQI